MPVIDLGSVVGPAGPQGATGATGAQGLQGNPGPNQVTNQTSTNLVGVLQGASSKVSVKPVDSAPTANSTNLVSSGAVKTALDAKANQAQIAYVETEDTASRAYAVGECFCWNGRLYRVTAAISSGGDINPGTNCEQTTVSDSFDSTWTFIGENTGTASISLPSRWKELLADVYYENVHLPIYVKRDTLKGSNNYFRNGYYYNSTYNGGCSVSVGNAVASLQSCYAGGTDRTSETIARYYWR